MDDERTVPGRSDVYESKLERHQFQYLIDVELQERGFTCPAIDTEIEEAIRFFNRRNPNAVHRISPEAYAWWIADSIAAERYYKTHRWWWITEFVERLFAVFRKFSW